MIAKMEHVVVHQETPTRIALIREGGAKAFVSGGPRCLDRSDGGGEIRYVIDSESTRPQVVAVSINDADSVRILDALPAHSNPAAVGKLLDAITPLKELDAVAGGITADGGVVTIRAADQRYDFVIGSDKIPTIQDVHESDGIADVHVLLPNDDRLRLKVLAPDLDATTKAIAVMRASQRDEAAAAASSRVKIRWQYKVVKNLTASKLEETLNGFGQAGWELVSMTGLDGVVSITGNKLYAVLKKRL